METHILEPGGLVVNEAYFRAEWRGLRCPLGNTDGFRFLHLLAGARGQSVSFAEIAEHCLGDGFAPSANVRSLKRRVVRKLRASGMRALADAIKSDKEHYRLDPA
ncbi:MAG: hypothetical protein L0Z62_03380 [Gemmataceae bacterium]|nr:hypothetical protein [Gemmataceae bacterium]